MGRRLVALVLLIMSSTMAFAVVCFEEDFDDPDARTDIGGTDFKYHPGECVGGSEQGTACNVNGDCAGGGSCMSLDHDTLPVILDDGTCESSYSWGSEQWAICHEPTGDANGSGNARITIRSGQTQFFAAWFMSASSRCASGHSDAFAKGTVARIRARMKVGTTWSTSLEHKSIENGTGGTGENRQIIHITGGNVYSDADTCKPPSSAQTCNWASDTGNCTSNADCICNAANECGATTDDGSQPNGLQYQCVSPITTSKWYLNASSSIDAPCVGPAPSGGLDLGEWVWVQVERRFSNAADDGYLKIWVNDADNSSPDSEGSPDMCLGSSSVCTGGGSVGPRLGLAAWGSHMKIGAHVGGGALSQDASIYFGHYILSKDDSFDSTWGPAAAGAASSFSGATCSGCRVGP